MPSKLTVTVTSTPRVIRVLSPSITIEQLVLRADKEKLIREFGLEKVQQWENEINSTKI
jgi:hypothetical protein